MTDITMSAAAWIEAKEKSIMDNHNEMIVQVELPKHVWRSLRSVTSYYIRKLDRKASKSGSQTSADYDRNRIKNLQQAVDAIDEGLKVS